MWKILTRAPLRGRCSSGIVESCETAANLHTVASSCLVFGSVIHGVGELDLKLKDDSSGIKAVKNMPPEMPCPDCPYLLLDLREREEFDSCHIISGIGHLNRFCLFKRILCDKRFHLWQLQVSPRSCCFEP